jgi:hypothetical protein
LNLVSPSALFFSFPRYSSLSLTRARCATSLTHVAAYRCFLPLLALTLWRTWAIHAEPPSLQNVTTTTTTTTTTTNNNNKQQQQQQQQQQRNINSIVQTQSMNQSNAINQSNAKDCRGYKPTRPAAPSMYALTAKNDMP